MTHGDQHDDDASERTGKRRWCRKCGRKIQRGKYCRECEQDDKRYEA